MRGGRRRAIVAERSLLHGGTSTRLLGASGLSFFYSAATWAKGVTARSRHKSARITHPPVPKELQQLAAAAAAAQTACDARCLARRPCTAASSLQHNRILFRFSPHPSLVRTCVFPLVFSSSVFSHFFDIFRQPFSSLVACVRALRLQRRRGERVCVLIAATCHKWPIPLAPGCVAAIELQQ